MKCSEINIRDPFVIYQDGTFCMYGTRAANFGQGAGGFGVYTSSDLETWSDPIPCFDSVHFGMNRHMNWAPEVHVHKGTYYMLATFTREYGLKGTYILRAESLMDPFVPHGDNALTPAEWECLDGTLYVSLRNRRTAHDMVIFYQRQICGAFRIICGRQTWNPT